MEAKPGRHNDGAGLYLLIRPDGRKGWMLRYRMGDRQRDMGLGSYPEVSLAAARETARAARERLRAGVDPIAARAAERATAARAVEDAGERTFKRWPSATSPATRRAGRTTSTGRSGRARWRPTPIRALVRATWRRSTVPPCWMSSSRSGPGRRRLPVGCAAGSSSCSTMPRPRAGGRQPIRPAGASCAMICPPRARSGPWPTSRRWHGSGCPALWPSCDHATRWRPERWSSSS